MQGQTPPCRRIAFVGTVTAMLAAVGSPASAQCPAVWNLASLGQPSIPTDPPIRQNHAAAYDPVAQLVVVHGGFRGGVGFGFYADTWGWSGEGWTQLAATGPSLRGNHGLAFDTSRGRLMLFGGATTGGVSLGDTWEWDGAAWAQASPAASPPGRFNHAMAYDGTRNVVVMTGGFSTLRHSDTWEYNGTTWTERVGTTFGARSSHGMAFDIARNKMVIFGGFNGTRLGDTREFDAATGNWSQIAVVGPTGRQYVGMTYDPGRGGIVVFGGQTGPGTLETDRQQDTWLYDGTAWSQLGTTGPSRRDQHTLTYNSANDTLVAFGGYQGLSFGGVAGDTWVAEGCGSPPCYPNCDGSTTAPILNVTDFACFLNSFAAGESYANCDGSTSPPVLNVQDFACFLNAFAAGCP